MSEQKQLTDWFPGSVKPARPGVYETDSLGSKARCFQHWNGSFWGTASFTPEEAATRANAQSNFQDDAWRGLASDPAAPAKPAKPTREWLKWAVAPENGDVATCRTRAYARAYAKGIGARVIRVRLVEVL